MRARVCVRARALGEVCFDCVLVLCFVMGYVLQFGEIAHKRVHYYYIILKSRKLYKMSECIDDMDAYTNLTDGVFLQILLTPSEDAKGILLNIQRRNLYRCVGESSPFTTGMTVRLFWISQPCSQ